MPQLIKQPTSVAAAGEPPKLIEEFIGRVNTNTDDVSIARMTSPPGWSEPGQRPEFNEYTMVLEGELRIESDEGTIRVAAGEAVIVESGQWVRYSTPGGAKYIAICTPAFSPETVHRDEED